MTTASLTREARLGGPRLSGQAPERADRKPEIGASLLCLLVMAAVYVLAVRTTLGQVIDTAAMTATADLLGQMEWTQTVLELVSPLSLVLPHRPISNQNR